jgi:hypothetical protein
MIFQPFLAIYVSISSGVDWEGGRMGGAETEISPACRKAGNDVD